MTRGLSIAVLSFSTVLILGAADNDAVRNQAGDSVLVEVDGVKFTLADFENRRPAALFQARNNFHEAERKAVDEFVSDYLLIREAQKLGITVPELLERNTKSESFKPPSDETLRVYYEGVDTSEPYEAVRDKIIEAIRTRRIAKAKATYLQSLRQQAKIEFRLSAPRAPITLKDTPLRGAANAPVTIVEFADFECPYCQQIQPVVDKLLADYKDKVAFAFKDFPLPNHAQAQKAAEAAHCALAQGKYWEFHASLFNTREFDVAKMKNAARTLQLDGNAFNQCLDSGAKAGAVKAHFEEAQALGLPGTPAFFVNGRLINPNGTVSYSTLQQLIEEELTAAAQRTKENALASGGPAAPAPAHR
ncbi:MAG: oxidoreductase [Candidatus Solibacter sp.]|nr:oxidoreductase [Candidatus Solibacter sp.]